MSVFQLQAHGWSGMLSLLPPNGLDRSLHAPVLVGLVLLALFKELFGWSYAGVVVPGYLASVFLVAPVTGVLVLAEAILAYLLASMLGRWLPMTGAWSSFFGRERFLLLILTALFSRLWVEAYWVPILVQRFELSHSRELYSIGLVLVPLLANSFWNVGFLKGFPRVMLVTLLTFVFVNLVLVRFTNFSVARFQMANESVSLQFLDSPHAYIILLVGAVLGARDNVRYGWDYNGILVPALLAVACYQPAKLATTLVEALVILVVSKWVSSHGPLSKLLIVGSRRMVVAFVVGFVLKWILGVSVYSFLPEVKMIDYFGFGYLLPTLLAVKMWNTDRVGVTVMATLQVAVTAFLVGNGIGFGLRLLEGPASAGELRSEVTRTQKPVALELMLSDTAPDPEPPRAWGFGRTQPELALEVLRDALTAEFRAGDASLRWPSSLRVSRRDSGWWTFVPRVVDPDFDLFGPRIAVRLPAHEAESWAVIVDRPALGSPSFAIAERIASEVGARAIFVRSRLPGSRAHDDAFMDAAFELLSIEHRLSIRVGGDDVQLSSVGGLPPGISVAALQDLLGTTVNLSWRAASVKRAGAADAVELSIPPRIAEERAAAFWAVQGIVSWEGPPEAAIRSQIEGLTNVAPGGYQAPEPEELRLLGRTVLPALLGVRRSGPPSPWRQALAERLGYRFARVGAGEAWVLYEAEGAARQGKATLLMRGQATHDQGSGRGVLVEVPAPRWEQGVVNASLALFAGLRADGLLLAGSLPLVSPGGEADMRRSESVRSYYQHAHEVWLQQGGHAVSVRAMGAGDTESADGVVAFDRPEATPFDGPQWTQAVVAMLQDNALKPKVVDGGLKTAAYSGLANPAMSYARAFAPNQMMMVWLSTGAREVLSGVREHPLTAERAQRMGHEVRELPLGETAVRWSRCRNRMALAQVESECEWVGHCTGDEAVQALFDYTRTGNPYSLLRALRPSTGCAATVVRDSESKQLWGLASAGTSVTAVPLRGAPVAGSTAAISDPTRVRAALALGLTALELEVRE